MAIPGYVVPGQIVCPLIEKQDSIIRKYQAGHGVVERSFGNIIALSATVVGKVQIVSLDGKNDDDVIMVEEGELSDNGKKNKSKSKPTELIFQVNIENKLNYRSTDSTTSITRVGTSVLPEVGDIVYARVVKLTLVQAHVEILVVENQGTISAESGLGVYASADGVIGLPSLSGQGASSGDVAEGFGGIIRIQDVRATQRDKVKIQESFKPGDIVRASVVSKRWIF